MNPEPSALHEQLRAVQQQLTALQDQLTSLRDQVKRIQGLVDREAVAAPSPGKPETGAANLTVQEVLADCARDILHVLKGAHHPLTTLEILDELVRQERPWRESTASHTLVHLVDHNLVQSYSENGGHKYGPKARA